MIVIDKPEQVIALQKLFEFIRFTDRKDEGRLSELLGSPIIADIHQLVYNEYSKTFIFNSDNNASHLNEIPTRYSSLKKNIEILKSYSNFEIDIASEVVDTLIIPYIADEEQKKELVKQLSS